LLGRHSAKELKTVVLIELHEDIGSSVFIEKAIKIFCLVELEVLIELSDVCGVQSSQFSAGIVGVIRFDY
jgi:hypothetical protein